MKNSQSWLQEQLILQYAPPVTYQNLSILHKSSMLWQWVSIVSPAWLKWRRKYCIEKNKLSTNETECTYYVDCIYSSISLGTMLTVLVNYFNLATATVISWLFLWIFNFTTATEALWLVRIKNFKLRYDWELHILKKTNHPFFIKL